MTILVSLLVALVGVLMIAFTVQGSKLATIGEIMLLCGLLACLMQLTPQTVGILTR